MYQDDDYYAILELSRSAPDAEVKKAYRRMALRWHPDKNQSNQAEAERRFKLISEAYEVLADPEKRRIYDEFGKAGLAEQDTFGQEQEFERQHQRERRHQRQYQHADYHFRDPRDVFREFFGPGDPFTRIFYNPNPFSAFEESTRNIGDRHRASNNVGGAFGSRGFAFGGNDFFSDFMSMGGVQASRISMGSAGPSSTRLQPLHTPRVTSTFTNTVNGRRVVVHKVTENGVETVTKIVDGVITEQTVNGHPVSLGDDWKAQVTAN